MRDALVLATSNLIVALSGAIAIAIVGGMAYFFAKLMFHCHP